MASVTKPKQTKSGSSASNYYSWHSCSKYLRLPKHPCPNHGNVRVRAHSGNRASMPKTKQRPCWSKALRCYLEAPIRLAPCIWNRFLNLSIIVQVVIMKIRLENSAYTPLLAAENSKSLASAVIPACRSAKHLFFAHYKNSISIKPLRRLSIWHVPTFFRKCL